MSEQKIVMWQLQNDASYNQFTPQIDCYTKEQTVSSLTKKCYSLTESAVPDDLFLKLIFGASDYGYRITVKLEDGSPVQGAVISGISALPNLDLKTNDKGMVIGKSSNSQVTISCTSPYQDMELSQPVEVVSTGLITDIELTLTLIPIIKITSSQSFDLTKISPIPTKFDVTLVGGGRSGGAGHFYDSDELGSSRSAECGTGGSGGYVVSSTNNNLNPDLLSFSCTIGSGGVGSVDYTGVGDSPATKISRNDGGSTFFKYGDLSLQASGGKGGLTCYYSVYKKQTYAGPKGNGNGGSTQRGAGGQGVGYIFNEQSLGLAGGGGGGGRDNVSSLSGQVYSSGGNPYGGDGAMSRTAPKSGTFGGGRGGCSGGSRGRYTPSSGAGGNRIIYLRFKK